MRILIVETSKVYPTSSIAHVRNAIILQKYLNKSHTCVLTDLTEWADITKQWDIILFSYATARADYSGISEVVEYQANARIGWITNEFELFANTFVKNTMDFMINNFNESGIKKAHTYKDLLTVNLNTLIAAPRNSLCEKKYGTVYYGTCRKYRHKYFQKYLKGDLTLSSSKKNWTKFKNLNISSTLVDKFSWETNKETLNKYKASLYIEDTKTHTCFNYMANRFFEGLYCNAPLFFDTSCQNTVDQDIYKIDPYFIVGSYDELQHKAGSINREKVENFLQTNTEIALSEKAKTLKTIETFLIDIIKKG